MTTLAQLPLFGSQPVHLGRTDRICTMCKVSIPFAAIWGADCCPGFTASVQAGMVLPGDPLEMEAAA